MSKYILAIDQGTTSTRAIIFNDQGDPQAESQKEFDQLFPQDAWVEHRPEDIWGSTLAVCSEVMQQAKNEQWEIAALGITNQRETTLIWDKRTGEALYNAIVWQDRRTTETCQALKAQGKEAMVNEKTGLLLDPYFSATKIRWILDHVEGCESKSRAGELCFGTVDTFLIWHLTKGAVHATDATNASRTLLYNINTHDWDDELLDLFNIPRALLPEVKDCSADFGDCDASIFGQDIPIGGVAGDQQAALIGQACFEPGMAKSTYGTGCFMMLNTGLELVRSQHKLLSTVAYRLNGQTTYALEGSIFNAGTIIQWMRDGLAFFQHAEESEALAKSAGYQKELFFVPAFTGLGAPYWDPDARASLTGITRDTSRSDIVSAGLMSVALQTADLLKAMQKDGAQFPSHLRIDGGMVENDWFAQCLADLMQLGVERPKNLETTALGAAFLAGLFAGVYESTEDISANWLGSKSFEPLLSETHSRDIYIKWSQRVAKVLSH